MMDYVSKIIELETTGLSEEDVAELFQYLIDNAIIDGLQGSYQRTAKYLIEQGYCHLRD